jgi:hypothetical protein
MKKAAEQAGAPTHWQRDAICAFFFAIVNADDTSLDGCHGEFLGIK